MLVIFFGYLVILFVIAEIFTVLFQLTGLSRQKANFQVISLLTSTGFTTKESELIALSTVRRKIASYVMIFGYCSAPIIASMVIRISRQDYSNEDIFILLSSIVIIFFILRSKFIRKPFDSFIRKIASKFFLGEYSENLIIIETFNKSVVAEVKIKEVPTNLQYTKISDTDMSSKFGIILLSIERDKEIISKVEPNHILLSGDILYVYGNIKSIKKFFFKQKD